MHRASALECRSDRPGALREVQVCGKPAEARQRGEREAWASSLFADGPSDGQKSYWSEALMTIASAAKRTTPAAPHRTAELGPRRRLVGVPRCAPEKRRLPGSRSGRDAGSWPSVAVVSGTANASKRGSRWETADGVRPADLRPPGRPCTDPILSLGPPRPSSISSPGLRAACLMRRPFSQVPFRLPVSISR
jgi:hypothetical protein